MKQGLLFPGQGSQSVGMGLDFFQKFSCAKETFEEVDDVLSPLYGHKLSSIIFEGPLEKLTQTIYTQPALMVTSIAIFRVLQKHYPHLLENVVLMAGHSLGEYSALCASGVLSLKDTAELLFYRGEAMAHCVPTSQTQGSFMTAIMGLDHDVLERIALEAGCFMANDNGGGQIVLAGTPETILKAMDLAKTTGAKRVLPLSVSAPFHCPLMRDAEKVMTEKLGNTLFFDAKTPIIQNFDAKPESQKDQFAKKLIQQICGRVRWRETIMHMAAYPVERYLEIGSGKVLSGLCKRMTPDIPAISVGTVHDIESLAYPLSA